MTFIYLFYKLKSGTTWESYIYLNHGIIWAYHKNKKIKNNCGSKFGYLLFNGPQNIFFHHKKKDKWSQSFKFPSLLCVKQTKHNNYYNIKFCDLLMHE